MKTLVLSGGGDLGSIQVGVLKYLILEKNHKYNAMYGTSVGALNVSFLSMFKDEKEGIIELEKFWLSIRKKDIYKRWFPFGELHSLWKSSIYDSKPLIKLVNKTLDLNKIRNNNRKIGVGAVSLTTGKYKFFNESHPEFINAVLASSSFPIAFKPIEIEGELYSDGGLKHVAPFSDAIELDNPIDAVLTYSENRKYDKLNKNSSIFKVVLNSLLYMRQQIEDGDVLITKLYNDLVKGGLCSGKKFADINIYGPEYDLLESSLDFNHDAIIKNIELGYELAKKQHK